MQGRSAEGDAGWERRGADGLGRCCGSVVRSVRFCEDATDVGVDLVVRRTVAVPWRTCSEATEGLLDVGLCEQWTREWKLEGECLEVLQTVCSSER